MSFLSGLIGGKKDEDDDQTAKMGTGIGAAMAAYHGGMVQKPKKMAAGGGVGAGQAASGPNGGQLTTTGHDTRSPMEVAGPIGAVGAWGTHTLGDVTKGIGSAFTVQNQYQAQNAPTDYTNYQNAIADGANNAFAGYNQFNANQQSQQDVANRYTQMAEGRGANPAQAMLNNATGQNAANTTAAMASMRGTGANPGMMARQAGNTGAMAQQQAIGQAAALQAQQQVQGLQGMGTQYGQMGSQIQGEQNTMAGLFSNAANAQNAQNSASIANYGMSQGINSQIAQNNANASNKTTAGLINMGGMAMGLAHGGKIPSKMAFGGVFGSEEKPLDKKTEDQKEALDPKKEKQSYTSALGTPMGGSISTPYASGFSNSQALSGDATGTAKKKKDPSKSDVWNHLNSDAKDTKALPEAPAGSTSLPMNDALPMPNSQGVTAPTPNLWSAHGGQVPALVSPGEKYLNPDEAQAVANGNVSPESVGKKIPGKAKVKGDSFKNDTVPATLESGGCVIPRSVMESDNPMKHSIAFVRAHMSKSAGLKGKKKASK